MHRLCAHAGGSLGRAVLLLRNTNHASGAVRALCTTNGVVASVGGVPPEYMGVPLSHPPPPANDANSVATPPPRLPLPSERKAAGGASGQVPLDECGRPFIQLPQRVEFQAITRAQADIARNLQTCLSAAKANKARHSKKRGGKAEPEPLPDLTKSGVPRLGSGVDGFLKALGAEMHGVYHSAKGPTAKKPPRLGAPTVSGLREWLGTLKGADQWAQWDLDALDSKLALLSNEGDDASTDVLEFSEKVDKRTKEVTQYEAVFLPRALSPSVTLSFIAGLCDILTRPAATSGDTLALQVRRAVREGARALRDTGGPESRQHRGGEVLLAWLDFAEFRMFQAHRSKQGQGGAKAFEFSFHESSQAHARAVAERQCLGKAGKPLPPDPQVHADDAAELAVLRALQRAPHPDAAQSARGLVWMTKLAAVALDRCCEVFGQAMMAISLQGHHMPGLRTTTIEPCPDWLLGRCGRGARCPQGHAGAAAVSTAVNGPLSLLKGSKSFKSTAQANRLLSALAREGDPAALVFQGASLHEAKKFNSAFPLLERAAAQHDPRAQFYLGFCYFKGKGGAERDYAQAARHFKEAALQGDPRAQAFLGVCYSWGEGVDRNWDEAVRWFRLAAEQGDQRAQHELAKCLQSGKGVAKDERLAAYWFLQAALRGDKPSRLNLARCFSDGVGVERDEALARLWFAECAIDGHPFALQWWARPGPGRGNEQFAAALHDHQALTSQGAIRDEQLETRLVQLVEEGRGDVSAAEKAMVGRAEELAQYKPAAAWAQLLADAKSFEEAKDWANAVRLYAAAASQGISDAQVALGKCYEKGTGVKPNKRRAAQLFEAAKLRAAAPSA